MNWLGLIFLIFGCFRVQKTFKVHDLTDLYTSYARRIQNAYFNVYLLLQVFISLLYMCSILIVNYVMSRKSIFKIATLDSLNSRNDMHFRTTWKLQPLKPSCMPSS